MTCVVVMTGVVAVTRDIVMTRLVVMTTFRRATGGPAALRTRQRCNKILSIEKALRGGGVRIM
jgi:hypothetical protein